MTVLATTTFVALTRCCSDSGGFLSMWRRGQQPTLRLGASRSHKSFIRISFGSVTRRCIEGEDEAEDQQVLSRRQRVRSILEEAPTFSSRVVVSVFDPQFRFRRNVSCLRQPHDDRKQNCDAHSTLLGGMSRFDARRLGVVLPAGVGRLATTGTARPIRQSSRAAMLPAASATDHDRA